MKYFVSEEIIKKVVFLYGIIVMICSHQLNGIIIIGHRGACGYEPENTIASFQKAIELGVDMIEFDVYLCKSGEVVVIHDKKVDRVTDGSGFVADKTLSELKKLNASKGQRIPTLQEVLDFIDRRVQVNIELKGPYTAEPVVQIIQEYVTKKGWDYDDFFVSSYDHYAIKKCKQLCPQILCGAILEGIPINLGAFADAANADFVSLSLNSIPKNFVDDLHKRGKQVFVFTVDDEDEIHQMVALGVDGIISNYPDRVIHCIKQN